jgi:pimeloyl-ACP methyl ester carboxylesterase
MNISRSRIAALAVITLLIGGLLYLRFGSAPAAVTVPAGARAGDLRLTPCHYGNDRADCGTLVVAENRGDPRSRLIALPVIRIRATSARPAEPIFRLNGGPGLTNMTFATADRFIADHDVVMVGYRGVDGSSVLDCPEVESALRHSSDFLSGQSFDAYANAFRACAARLTRTGVDLAGYSMTEQVDDFEAARVALGYGPVDLLSESAGTRLAMIYAWRYPQSVHRSVMIGVNPPGNFVWNPTTTDTQLQYYSQLCARDASCRRRTTDLAASMQATSTRLPDRWLFLPIEPGNVRLASFFGLVESQPTSPIAAPATLDSWLAAADGDPSGLWFQSFAAGLLFPSSFTWGEFAAIGRADAPYVIGGAVGPDGSILGNAGNAFTWGAGQLVDAWPAATDDVQYGQVRPSTVETLLIGGTVDFATPPQNATTQLLPALPNGHQVVLADLGHTGDFWSYQPEASSRLIETFLATGTVDTSLYRTATVDFTPGLTQTAIAKGLVGVLVGGALLAVVSLVWMALRVRRRGPYGRRAGALLRSLYLLPLGLGGWFLGALVVLTALPGVPVDDEVLVSLSVSVPVGLGVYLAWARYGRLTGLGLAATGALAGGFLGYHATSGIGALITTIVGAAVGANLILLLLDLASPPTARS